MKSFFPVPFQNDTVLGEIMTDTEIAELIAQKAAALGGGAQHRHSHPLPSGEGEGGGGGSCMKLTMKGNNIDLRVLL